MLIALNKDNKEILANNAQKKEKYICRFCKEELIFKKGRIKISHFAHFPNSTCIIKGEHYNHIMFKFIILNQLNQFLHIDFPLEIEIEKSFNINNEKRIADIYIKNLKIVLEFQHSNISINDWKIRTNFYKKIGLIPIWIFDKQSYGKEKNKKYIQVPEIFIYLRKFYPLYLFDLEIPQKIFILKLGSKKETYHEGYEWFDTETKEMDGFSDYTYYCKNTFKFELQEIEWFKLMIKESKEFKKKMYKINLNNFV